MLEKLKINRKLLKQLDFSLIVVVIIIVAIGTLNIYSATQPSDRSFVNLYYVKRQIGWLFIGLFIVYITLLFDYVLLSNYAPIFYWAGVLLLLLNKFTSFGKTTKGATSWVKIGPISLQPSEFVKLGIIIMLAKKLNDMEGEINKAKNFFILLLYAAIPMLLIVIQPDMGMTMVCFFIVLGIFFVAGLDMKVILGGLTSIVILVAAVWNSGIMKSYWKGRLVSFLHPEQYELTLGLQLIQSKIGIGSGGILGKGFLKGTQVSGGFIPEAYTDFIFSVVGEEWGLVGSVILLILFAILIYKFIKIGKNSKDIFGSVICTGIASYFIFAILQNIGMTIGLAPITGITLPFMSYGGSSMITNFIALGLILNVGMRRKKINF